MTHYQRNADLAFGRSSLDLAFAPLARQTLEGFAHRRLDAGRSVSRISRVLRSISRRLATAASAIGLGTVAYYGLGLVRRLTHPRLALANRRLRREGAPDGLPLPTDRLLFLISGEANVASYLNGARTVGAIRSELEQAGVPIESGARVLDFGCGCGRVLRHWRDVDIHGCDYNEYLVEWCRANLPHATAATNQPMPPLPYPDASFDVVYALSVFTHLPADAQRPWLEEMRRVLRPGGVLFLTVMGSRFTYLMSEEEARRFGAGHLVVTNAEYAGTNICAAFTPERYVRTELAPDWQILRHQATGDAGVGLGAQDIYVMRR